MRSSLLFAAASMVLLTACGSSGVPVSPVSGTGGTALSAPSSVAVVNAWSMMVGWMPSLTWSDPVRGTNDDAIMIDAQHSIPAHAIQAQSMTAQDVAFEDFALMGGSLRDALDAKAAAQGWTKQQALDADGPTGTQWGYRMQTSDGMRFLIVAVTGVDCTATDDAPVHCPHFVAKVTMTDALAAGDDL